jgi:hypothetical protein
MENFAKDLIAVLQYLLPGFLAAWVFYGFTSFAKPSQFERVVEALVFTLIVQSIVFVESAVALSLGHIVSMGTWTPRCELVCSSITAFFLGAIFAYFANNDRFHALARKVGLTRETSYPSEWFGVFLENVTYIVLHFEDERRLYGWVKEWPSEPDKGHFALTQASWLVDDKEIPITGVGLIMVNVKDVKWVEFMKTTGECKNEQKSV